MREARLVLGESELAAMGIDALVSHCRRAGLCEVEMLECTGTGALVEVTVERPLEEAEIASLSYVDRLTFIAERDGRDGRGSRDGGDGKDGRGERDGRGGKDVQYRYVVDFEAPGLPDAISTHTEDLLVRCTPDLRAGEATITLVGPQAAIRAVVGTLVDHGVRPELRKLGEYGGPERPLDGLTDRQREVLQTAYEAGYYDVPRNASAADVATRLEIGPSTVVEHLQRAERNVLARHLGEG